MKKKINSINSILNKLLSHYNLTHIYLMEIIKKSWLEMDKTIAAHAEPIEYNPSLKVLKLKINSVNWKKEFLENRELLLTKVNNYYKTIEINKIELI